MNDPEQKAALGKQSEAVKEDLDRRNKEIETLDEEIGSLDRDIGDARKRLRTAKDNLKLAEAGRRLSDTQAVTDRLKAHVDEAVRMFEAGEIKRTDAEKAAVESGKMPPETSRGNVIHRAAAKLIWDDPYLKGLELARPGISEPDIYDPVTKRWWDITTPEEWADHVTKYQDRFGKDHWPLYTRPPRKP